MGRKKQCDEETLSRESKIVNVYGNGNECKKNLIAHVNHSLNDLKKNLKDYVMNEASEKSNLLNEELKEKNPILHEMIEVQNKIGTGAFSEIWAVKNKKKNWKMALKLIRHNSMFLKNHSLEKFKNVVLNEVTIQINCKNRHINSALGYYTLDSNSYAIIQELATRGSLLDFLKNLKEKQGFCSSFSGKKRISENLICYITYNLVLGLEHLYKLSVLHNDIKPENVLVNERFELKLTDFSISEKLNSSIAIHTFQSNGTPGFFSPEKIKNQFVLKQDSFKSDYFSLGVMIYFLMFDKFPFGISSRDSLENQYLKMKNNPLIFPNNIECSDDLKNLLRGLLKLDYKMRFNIDEILKSEWIKRRKKIELMKENYKDLEKFFLDLSLSDFKDL